MNKTIHGLILAFFGIACAFLWGMLTTTVTLFLMMLPTMVAAYLPLMAFVQRLTSK